MTLSDYIAQQLEKLLKKHSLKTVYCTENSQFQALICIVLTGILQGSHRPQFVSYKHMDGMATSHGFTTGFSRWRCDVGLVVQKLDASVNRISYYPVDSSVFCSQLSTWWWFVWWVVLSTLWTTGPLNFKWWNWRSNVIYFNYQICFLGFSERICFLRKTIFLVWQTKINFKIPFLLNFQIVLMERHGSCMQYFTMYYFIIYLKGS